MIPEGLHRIRGRFGKCFVLVDPGGRATVIDTGLFGYAEKIRRLFAALGLFPGQVDAILLTHGHLDHAGNLAWLKAWTGAPVHAHALEQAHIDGAYPYRGFARGCGVLEALGRSVIRYRGVAIDHAIADGDELPFWGGLRVIHLPGHTLGHCGFWSERHRLLFSGDLVAIWRTWTQIPPRILNVDRSLIPHSLRKAAALQPRLVCPNHCSNRLSLQDMAERLCMKAG